MIIDLESAANKFRSCLEAILNKQGHTNGMLNQKLIDFRNANPTLAHLIAIGDQLKHYGNFGSHASDILINQNEIDFCQYAIEEYFEELYDKAEIDKNRKLTLKQKLAASGKNGAANNLKI